LSLIVIDQTLTKTDQRRLMNGAYNSTFASFHSSRNH
jgi:hypothetical protein